MGNDDTKVDICLACRDDCEWKFRRLLEQGAERYGEERIHEILIEVAAEEADKEVDEGTFSVPFFVLTDEYEFRAETYWLRSFFPVGNVLAEFYKVAVEKAEEAWKVARKENREYVVPPGDPIDSFKARLAQEETDAENIVLKLKLKRDKFNNARSDKFNAQDGGHVCCM